jgi:pimeloyl-ACP methyl ester carboxylesterase
VRADGARGLSHLPPRADRGARRSRAALPEIDGSTLILAGDDDRVIPVASSELLHEPIRNSLLYVISAAGHQFFVERPDETARALGTLVPV